MIKSCHREQARAACEYLKKFSNEKKNVKKQNLFDTIYFCRLI